MRVHAAVDNRKSVVACPVDIAVGESHPEALRVIEAVEIDLGLRVVVRRIRGPLSGEVQDLPILVR